LKTRTTAALSKERATVPLKKRATAQLVKTTRAPLKRAMAPPEQILALAK